MVEKVKITEEQADAIEYLSGEYPTHQIVRNALDENWCNEPEEHHFNIESLNGMDPETLVFAVHRIYEIEPEPFKVGHWAKATHEKIGTFIGRITKIDYSDEGEKRAWATWNTNHGQSAIEYKFLERCSLEEVSEIKKQRFWNHRGRAVGEFREGDVGVTINNQLSLKHTKEFHNRGQLRGFYPVESFVSFEGGDTND